MQGLWGLYYRYSNGKGVWESLTNCSAQQDWLGVGKVTQGTLWSIFLALAATIVQVSTIFESGRAPPPVLYSYIMHAASTRKYKSGPRGYGSACESLIAVLSCMQVHYDLWHSTMGQRYSWLAVTSEGPEQSAAQPLLGQPGESCFSEHIFTSSSHLYQAPQLAALPIWERKDTIHPTKECDTHKPGTGELNRLHSSHCWSLAQKT